MSPTLTGIMTGPPHCLPGAPPRFRRATAYELTAELTDNIPGRLSERAAFPRLDDGIHLTDERLQFPDRPGDVLLIYMRDHGCQFRDERIPLPSFQYASPDQVLDVIAHGARAGQGTDPAAHGQPHLVVCADVDAAVESGQRRLGGHRLKSSLLLRKHIPQHGR